MVAFNGVKGRANDSKRVADLKQIQKSLELYKNLNSTYPPSTVSGVAMGGWEASSNEPADKFLTTS